ncbi:hypothetical protein DSO57_1018433 [Entomophthora muscae]|uniref:Uncharacterized protein n=1 Tax=Entomophthora muscae TaxID=34485 RepID=A0ACC2UD85_9FUNG|nr:hypothetical protein DSO57_1018433 [Entomophthora muscae]
MKQFKTTSLKCTRTLLNPSFESYKLQLLDNNVGGSLLIDSKNLPSELSFDLTNDSFAKRNLTYSELKWISEFNHAHVKFSVGTKEAIVCIDSDLNVLCVSCSKEGDIQETVLANLSDESFKSEFLTLPTIKLLSADNSKVTIVVFTGKEKAFIIDIFEDLSSKTTRNFNLPQVSSEPNETWALMDILKEGISTFKLVCCVKTLNPENNFAIAFLELKEFDLKLLCSVPGNEFPLVSNVVDDGTGFYIACKKQFGADSISEIKLPSPQTDLPYTWLQTNEDLTVHFSLKNAVETKEINCILKDFSLILEEPSSKSAPLSQNWFGKINSSESLWTIEDGRWLTLHLEKADKGTRWSNLFNFDDGVMEALDPNELAEIRESLDKYTGDPKPRYSLQQPFGSEIEQEDFEGEEFGIFLYDATGRYQQTVSSGGMSWLGESLEESDGSPSCFFLRYDVDALIFTDQPPFEHFSSFDAIGYVQASKKNCKFSTVSSDLRLLMIVESTSNIYLYGKPSSSKRQAPQAVVQVPSDSPIQGVQLMFNRFLLVLTQRKAYTFDISPFISKD